MSRDPEPLAEAISRLIALRGLARSRGSEQMTNVWREVAGEHLARGTRVISFQRGILNIGVSNAALLSELVSFHQGELLGRLKREHADLKIRSLKFRLQGRMDDSP